jgi:proteasome accessory factor C
VRLFRLDRLDDVTVLDEPATPPADAAPVDVSAGVFRARPEHGTAVLLLEPRARWIAEYYPVEDLVELPVTARPDGDPADRHGQDGGDRSDDDAAVPRPAPDQGGRARVVLRYADPGWLVRLVLGLGGGARVLHPPELVAEVAQRARAALSGAEVSGVEVSGVEVPGSGDTDPAARGAAGEGDGR